MPTAARLLLACVALSLSTLAQAAGDELTAHDIVVKMIRRYQELHAYHDEATFDARFVNARLRGKTTTSYVGPDAVLVSVESERTTPLVYDAHGETFRSWSGKTGWEIYDSREIFLGALKGSVAPIGLAPHRILGMYFSAEMLGQPLSVHLAESRRLPDESIDGISCYRLKAQSDQTRLDLWIGTADLLIRRIDDRSPFGTATVRIAPQADPQLTSEDLVKEAERRTRL